MSKRSPFPDSLLNQSGLNRQAIFDVADLPENIRNKLNTKSGQLILIGHGGRLLWEKVQAANLCGSDPIDDFTIATIQRWFADFLPGRAPSLERPRSCAMAEAPMFCPAGTFKSFIPVISPSACKRWANSPAGISHRLSWSASIANGGAGLPIAPWCWLIQIFSQLWPLTETVRVLPAKAKTASATVRLAPWMRPIFHSRNVWPIASCRMPNAISPASPESVARWVASTDTALSNYTTPIRFRCATSRRIW